MWSSQAYTGRNSRLYKGGVLKHSLESLLACLKVESSSLYWKVFSLFKLGVLKHTLGGLLACLNVEYLSIHWKVFLLV